MHDLIARGDARAYDAPDTFVPLGVRVERGATCIASGTMMSRPIQSTTLAHPDMPDPSVLQRIAQRLRESLKAERVVVFGSVARGDATIHSDIDLLVIAPTTESPYWRMARARETTRDLSIGLPISPLVLTPAEVEHRLHKGDSFITEILDQGIEL